MNSVQVIKRREGASSEKSTVESVRTQVSFNSDGRLVVRAIQFSDDGNAPNDTLIVFDRQTSARIVKFCQMALASQRPKFARPDPDDIPF